METNKGTRIFSAIMAFLLIGGLFWYANSLVGNPISNIIANRNARDYVNETYPDMGLETEDAVYDIINRGYKVSLRSPFSIDTHFSIYLNQTGVITEDSYEKQVLGKLNTSDRINSQYEKMVGKLFETNDFPYEIIFEYGYIILKDLPSEDFVETMYGIELENLKIDQKYDIKELSKKAGHISFYTEDSELNSKRTSEVLIDIKTFFDKENLQFYSMSLNLLGPNPKDTLGYRESYAIDDFLYSDIYEEGLIERVERAAKDLEKYRKKEEAEMETGCFIELRLFL